MSPKPRNWTRLKTLIGLCLLVFSLAVKENWPVGAEVLQETFLPGEPDITQLAASDFLEDLRQGVDFQDALRTFCLAILENADTV